MPEDYNAIDRGFAFSQEPGQAPQITDRLTMRIPKGSQMFDLASKGLVRKTSEIQQNSHFKNSLLEGKQHRDTASFGSSI